MSWKTKKSWGTKKRFGWKETKETWQLDTPDPGPDLGSEKKILL